MTDTLRRLGVSASRRSRVVLMIGVVFLSLRSLAAAQSSCMDALADAERYYALGQYTEAIDGIRKAVSDSGTPCLQALSLKDQVLAFALLARSYIAEQRLSDAEDAVAELIRRERDFRTVSSDPPLFADMLAQARLRLVRSVSKFAEDWREAPATISVVTAEEIAQRGYRDVEEVLHDLPAFDIARGNGDLYSTQYQRGYRSNATDRTLVLVDGIEQNDLHSNIAYISRQYPLSAIDRIEVVYGPASTMYGPNAFSGVINIITKEPEALIGDKGFHAVRAQGGVGAYDSGLFEGTYAGRSPLTSFSWSVTGRIYRSNEWDSARHVSFPATFDDAVYQQSLTVGARAVDKLLCSTPAPGGTAGNIVQHPERCALPTPAAPEIMQAIALGLFEARDVNNDGLVDLVPTALGIQRARTLDQAMWTREFGSNGFTLEDPTRDWFLSGKLAFSDFSFGIQTWRNDEGTAPWFSDLAHGPGGRWVPRQTAIYATYAKPVSVNWSLNLLIRYKNDQIDGVSTIPLMATYASGYLGLLNLVAETPSQYRVFHVDQVSTQFRTEVTAVYQRSTRLAAIVGADIRDGSEQAGYFIDTTAPLFSYAPDPTPDEIKATDIGLFAQGSYSWHRRLKAVLGLRYDGNQTRENEEVLLRQPGSETATLVPVKDFGWFVSPRAALVATFGHGQTRYLEQIPGQLIVKGIFSIASQQPPNFQRFATEPYVREFASPFLPREKATNTEISIGWEPVARTRFEVARYVTRYSDVLHTAVAIDPCCTPVETGQFQSIGEFKVKGIQATANGDWRRFGVYSNYTYTEAQNSDRLKDEFGDELIDKGNTVTRLPIGDIARHKFNIGGHATLWRSLDAGLRANTVGRRPTGEKTTSRLNDTPVPGYTIVNATLTYTLAPGRTVQLSLNNLFDTKYSDPGVRSAGAFGFAGSIPQPGFNAFLQAKWDLNVARRRIE